MKSTETLHLPPKVYSVNSPPESYISYHYTKSMSNNDAVQEKDDSGSFVLERELRHHIDIDEKEGVPQVISFNDLKRRTIIADLMQDNKEDGKEGAQW